MEKQKREGLMPVLALSIKPPAYVLDPTGGDNHTYKCVYVTAQGKQVTQKCNPNVWKRCEGRNLEGRPRDGLSDKLNVQFIMWIDKNQNNAHSDDSAKGVVVDVDVIPENFYKLKAVMPEDVQLQETIDFRVGPTGYIDVDKVPPGVTLAMLERMISELNKLDALSPGDIIPGGYEVTVVSGNRVSVLPPAKSY